MLVSKINEWLQEEKKLGSENPDRVVLATVSPTGKAHSRVVAIREINEFGILFFTQRETRKVADLKANPSASMTLWLPLQQREIVLEGIIEELTREENNVYWNSMPHDRQVRFSTYAPLSGKPISSLEQLEVQHDALSKQYQNQTVPMSEYYCGFRLRAESIYFYTLGIEKFSEVVMYSRTPEGWMQQLISP